MIADPRHRAAELAGWWVRLAPSLWRDLCESGVLAPEARHSASDAHAEWECFARYACVRALVAAGGFNAETAAAVDHFHARLLATDAPHAPSAGRVAERYAEYGGIGQALGARGAGELTARLGEAAARHIAHPAPASQALADTAGGLHEAVAEAAAEWLRRAEA